MGGARLRISAFPTVSESGDAHLWRSASSGWPRVTASHVHDNAWAILQDVIPASSADSSIPRFTWWDHRGMTEWIQCSFVKSSTIDRVSLYWFDDTGIGQCRVPKSWRLMYLSGDRWTPVDGAENYGVQLNKFNSVVFKRGTTAALRVEVQLQDGMSSGVLAWHLDR